MKAAAPVSPADRSRNSRRFPARRTVSSPALSSTRRCCDTDGRLIPGEFVGDAAGGDLAIADQQQDPPTGGIGDRLQFLVQPGHSASAQLFRPLIYVSL